MIDYDKCPDCNEFWINCPCCNTSFCPECMQTENQVDWDALEESEGEDNA